jgi:hypothetical protein
MTIRDVTEADLTFGTIQATLDLLRIGELRKLLDVMVALGAASGARSVDDYSEDQLREFLIGCVKTIHEQDPEKLKAVASSLDAIRRERFNKLFDKSKTSRGEGRSS